MKKGENTVAVSNIYKKISRDTSVEFAVKAVLPKRI